MDFLFYLKHYYRICWINKIVDNRLVFEKLGGAKQPHFVCNKIAKEDSRNLE